MTFYQPFYVQFFNQLVNEYEQEDSDETPRTRSKRKPQIQYINLESLARYFPLDGVIVERNQESEITSVVENDTVGFKSISLYQREPLVHLHRPPMGPIPIGYFCVMCYQRSERYQVYHSETCSAPSDSNLVNNQTEQRYADEVKRRGAIGIEKEAKTRFQGIEMKYLTNIGKLITVRFYASGKMLLINVPFMVQPRIHDYTVAKIVAKKVNLANDKSDGNVITPLYISEIGETYIIDTKKSQTAKIQGQIDIFEDKKTGIIDFDQMNKTLAGAINVYELPSRINYKDQELVLIRYEYKRGAISVTGSSTRDMIMAHFQVGSDKVYVQFERRGAVQLTASVCTEENTKGAHPKCLTFEPGAKLSDKNLYLLAEWIERTLRPDLSKIIKVSKSGKKEYGTIIGTMYNKQIAPECRKDRRPDPYSFKGECPSENQVNEPGGRKRTKTDTVNGEQKKLYEPCCYAIRGETNRQKYVRQLIEGFPIGDESIQFEVGETDEEDSKKTLTAESRRFKGLKEVSKDRLLKCIRDFLGVEDLKQAIDPISEDQDVIESYSQMIKSLGTELSPIPLINQFKMSDPEEMTDSTWVVTDEVPESNQYALFIDPSGDIYLIDEYNRIRQTIVANVPEFANSLFWAYLFVDPNPGTSSNGITIVVKDCWVSKGIQVHREAYLDDKEQSMARFRHVIRFVSAAKTPALPIRLEIRRFYTAIPEGLEVLTENESDIIFVRADSPLSVSGVQSGMIQYCQSLNGQLMSLNVRTPVETPDNTFTAHERAGIRYYYDLDFDGKKIPDYLLKTHRVKLPAEFVNSSNLKDSDIVLFRLNIDKNGKFNLKDQVFPVMTLPRHVSDFAQIERLLMAVFQKKDYKIFRDVQVSGTDFPTWTVGHLTYYQPDKSVGPLAVV